MFERVPEHPDRTRLRGERLPSADATSSVTWGEVGVEQVVSRVRVQPSASTGRSDWFDLLATTRVDHGPPPGDSAAGVRPGCTAPAPMMVANPAMTNPLSSLGHIGNQLLQASVGGVAHDVDQNLRGRAGRVRRVVRDVDLARVRAGGRQRDLNGVRHVDTGSNVQRRCRWLTRRVTRTDRDEARQLSVTQR